ncbi:MAG: DUF5110 domain-containing protein [Bacilli bacterium]|nr:DUF5110 domain-containing protein [Bacilli bacterium]
MYKSQIFSLIVLPATIGLASGIPGRGYSSIMDGYGPKKVVASTYELHDSNLRVQFLDKNTIRFEKKYIDPDDKKTAYWLDVNTFLIPQRHLYNGVDPTLVKVNENYQAQGKNYDTELDYNNGEIVIHLNRRNQNFANIEVLRNNRRVYDSSQDGEHGPDYKFNTGDLPAPGSSEEGNALSLIDYPRVLIPDTGYTTLSAELHPQFANSCGYQIQDQRDLYVMLYDDATDLRAVYNKLAGPADMVRLATLGAWDSRYYAYNERSVQLEVDKYHQYNLPLDNFVIDTDWRFAVSGTGYNVNTDLFPNMPRTLKSLHDQNLEVAFNDHPEPVGKDIDVLQVPEVANRNYNLQKILNMGLDTWWYDRNWSTSLISPTRRKVGEEEEDIIRHETWGQYLFNDITRQFYQAKAGGGNKYRRPVTMTNLVDVQNGRWNGTKDSATHRYSFQWTGDTVPEQLPSEIQNVVRSGNNAMPYMSSDLAGHTGQVANNYYYSRWIQYGALSPIFRIHCTNNLPIHCQPWYRLVDNDVDVGDEDIDNRFKRSIDMRYRLMPLFYQLARENYETGLPIARALAFNYPNDEKVKGMENEWMIGPNILFAPLSMDKDLHPLVAGDSGLTASYLNCSLGEDKVIPEPDSLDWKKATTMKIPAGTPINFDDMATRHPEGINNEHYMLQLEGSFTAERDSTLSVAYDDALRIEKLEKTDGTSIGTWNKDWVTGSERRKDTGLSLKEGETYNFTAYYYQNTEGGSLRMNEKAKTLPPLEETIESKQVYLPAGTWYDPFHSKVHNGGQTVTVDYDVDETPIFIRLGSMIPLVENAPTTKDINWNDIYYDIYPSTDLDASTSSYLYEDDYDTTGYKNNEYRKSPYQYKVEKVGDTYQVVIDLGAAKGHFDGDDEVISRAYHLQIHNVNNQFKDENITQVTIDGKAASHSTITATKDKQMPFGVNVAFNDDITTIDVPASSVRKGHQIVITYNLKEGR